MQQFRRYQICTFLLVKKRVPQNAAISKLSNLHLFTSEEQSPPKCSNFEDIKFAPFTSKVESPQNAAISSIYGFVVHLYMNV